MVSSYKNIAVFGDQCATVCKDDCDALPQCNLCKPCLDNKLKDSLLKAHAEFLHRGDFRRLVPLPMSQVKVRVQFLCNNNMECFFKHTTRICDTQRSQAKLIPRGEEQYLSSNYCIHHSNYYTKLT